MAEIKPQFRLRYLFSPAYMAARLAEIKSFSDAFNRAAKIPIYIYFLIVNDCYCACGFIKRLTPGAFFPITFPSAAKERLSGLLVKMIKVGITTLRFINKYRFAVEDRLRDITLQKRMRLIRPVPPGATVTPNIPPLEGLRPERLMRALWFINSACNYRCNYCWQSHTPNPAYPARSAGEYARYWEGFNRLYGPAIIEIIGGEPFILPNITEIISALSHKNHLSIITNLSWDPKVIIGKIKPGRVSLLASYHPGQAPSLEGFIEKIDTLRRSGFPVDVCLVAFPPDLPIIPFWLDALYRKGIFTIVLPFKGKWRGRSYPQAHTSLEREFISEINQLRYMYPGSVKARQSVENLNFATNFQLSGISPRGKLCNTGVNYCRILLSGEIVRCGQYESMDSVGAKSEIVGNLFKMDFHLPSKATPCLFDGCECLGENYYMAGAPLGPSNIEAIVGTKQFCPHAD